MESTGSDTVYFRFNLLKNNFGIKSRSKERKENTDPEYFDDKYEMMTLTCTPHCFEEFGARKKGRHRQRKR